MFRSIATPFRIVVSIFMMAATISGSVALSPQPALAHAGPDRAELDAFVTRMMEMYGVAGAAVAIIQDGQVSFAKGYGVRDANTEVPVDGQTKFAIGSITKSFVSLAMMQLVEQGLVDLDAPVITYLPEFQLATEEATQQVTVRHLLSNSSGLPRADELWYGTGKSRDEVVADMALVEPTAPPGQVWQYHNQNFVAAGLIIERITGESWEDYTRREIFEPLGMQTAGFGVGDLEQSENAAAPHALDIWQGLNQWHGQTPLPWTSPGLVSLDSVGPAGSIMASAHELATFGAFQLGDGSWNGHRLVSLESLHEMQRPQIPLGAEAPQGLPIEYQSYGLGWVNQDYRGYHLVEHNGGIDGFSTSLTIAPEHGMGIVILANADSAAPFHEATRIGLMERLLGIEVEQEFAEILNQLLGYDPEVRRAQLEGIHQYQADPAELEAIAGEYETLAGPAIVTVEDGWAYLEIAGLGKVRLAPYAPNSFLIDGNLASGTDLVFVPLEDGTIALVSNGQPLGQRRS